MDDGLSPSYFAVVGKQVFFQGWDAQHHSELWVTDGTVAGTHEVIVPGVFAGGLIGGQTFNAGLDPVGITAFDGKRALFNGIDAGGHLELWVTDGTVAGTHELNNIQGESTSGLHPANIAAFLDNKALFDGLDSSGHFELWITDGTVGGTHELIIPGASAGGLNPTNITVFGNTALFEGTDASGHNELWVTDGTVGGTHELTNILHASSAGLNPSDITLLGGSDHLHNAAHHWLLHP